MSSTPNWTPPSRLVKSRFNLREPQTKSTVAEVPKITEPPLTYSNPGRGQNGESSN